MVFGSPKIVIPTFGLTPLGSSYSAPPGYTATRRIITQDPRDVVTIAGKTELLLSAEEYSATLLTEEASHDFFNRT